MGGENPDHEHKRAYSDLAAEHREAGWAPIIHPMEVGCQDFVSASALWLLWDVGAAGAKLQSTTKALAEKVDGSFWLWQA